MIQNQEIVEDLVGHFGEKVFAFEEPYGLLSFSVSPADIIEIVTYLRDHKLFKFNFLTDITGVQFPENKGLEFCAVYHLHSWKNRVRLRIKAFMPAEKPEVPTLTGMFAGANWMERETFDFYGINFLGHPNMKRILNIEEMDYHPMRKEYPLEDATRNDKIDALFGR
ncbi:MAG: NADH-quinone oxidoreductase subunit C [Bacteroidetes bacterium]|nr:NADH-quinone oxidoreductase subunit C [Bacteroidota bacterium]